MKVKTVELEMFSPEALETFKKIGIEEGVRDYIKVLQSTVEESEKGSIAIVRKLFTCGEYNRTISDKLCKSLKENRIGFDEFTRCSEELDKISITARDIIRSHLMKYGLI